MRLFELKCDPAPFAAIAAGRKRGEMRRDDRGGYKPGDLILLRETFDPALVNDQSDEWIAVAQRTGYTGQEMLVRVTHAQASDPRYGIAEGFVFLSIEPVRVESSTRGDVAVLTSLGMNRPFTVAQSPIDLVVHIGLD